MTAFNKNNIALVVDDENISRQISAKMVEAQGWTVKTAIDGKSALSLWREKRYPLIITDCHMPNMDGFTLAKSIRDIEYTENTKKSTIIAFTANAAEEEKNRCKKAGMNDFMTKPINPAKLKPMLANFARPIAMATDQTSDINTNDEHNQNIILIDYSILEEIFPNREKQSGVLQELQTHIHHNFSELTHQIKNADLNSIENTAHKMKGACKMVGVNRIASICAEIEKTAKNGHVSVDLALSVLYESIVQFDSHLFQKLNQANHNLTNLRTG